MILIDHKDRRPIYEQVIERFQQIILCGAMPPNTPMPSVRSLAMELSLNPNTIQRAYQELERTGYIYTIKGKGSFVRDISTVVNDRKKEFQEELQSIVDKAFLIGMSGGELRQMFEQCIAKNIETISEKTTEK